jgi:hypothetical protein
MLLRVLQQRRDGATLIIRRDWRMASLADRHLDDALKPHEKELVMGLDWLLLFCERILYKLVAGLLANAKRRRNTLIVQLDG